MRRVHTHTLMNVSQCATTVCMTTTYTTLKKREENMRYMLKMISELFTVYLNRYKILLLVLHTQQSITIFFGTLQELNKFDCKPEFHLPGTCSSTTYMYCSNSNNSCVVHTTCTTFYSPSIKHSTRFQHRKNRTTQTTTTTTRIFVNLPALSSFDQIVACE